MSEDIQIRTVTVELLRSGPAHNQLLSPLTLYLGVCDDAEAGIVTLPYEQHTFMRRMKAMRYDDNADLEDTLPELRAMGVELAKVLGSIPRLPGSLGGEGQSFDTLVHLSLVLSASELALLPFELAKMPIGPTAWTESWLALQSRVPVVITRRTRNVAPRDLQWLKQPRVLFVASDTDQNNVPYKEHREALIKAVRPFVKGDLKPEPARDGKREHYGDMLTILKNARFEDVAQECAQNLYTHIHILAHGATDESRGDKSYGLVLKDTDDVISGERLASAFARLVGGAIHRPEVVTLATCDSGNQRDLVSPGASIAHILHQAGIPLVVASQFPLSKAGSIMVAQEFYSGLLWGDHPWIVLHRVRSGLHGRQKPKDHDWASLVVYEALPRDMAFRLDKARFEQCRRAMDAAFTPAGAQHREEPAKESAAPAPVAATAPAFPEVHIAAPEAHARHDPVDDVIARLPMSSKFVGMQALALRAGGRVQQASNMFFGKSTRDKSAGSFRARVLDCCSLLEQGLLDYETAVNGFLAHDGQGMNAPYRALVAQLCLSAVLGRDFPHGAWEMARYWVDTTLTLSTNLHDRLWACGCSAELWLLRMIDFSVRGSEEDWASADREHAGFAIEAIKDMMRLDRKGDSWACEWTCNQFQNYVDWWGTSDFEEVVIHFSQPERESFRGGKPSVVQTAAALMGMLGKMRGVRPLGDPGRDRGLRAAIAQRDVAIVPPAAIAPEVVAAAPVIAAPPATPPVPAAVTPKPATARAVAARKASAAPAQERAKVAAGSPFFTIEMLLAGHGDALWIEYGLAGGPPSRVLIDCGTESTYQAALKPRIGQLAPDERVFELFILSHIDADHIGGAIPFLGDLPNMGVSFGDVWFNGWKHLASMLGAKQGEQFSLLIKDNKLPWNKAFNGAAVVRPADTLPTVTLPGGMVLTLLSPTREKLAALAPKWDKAIKALGMKPGDEDSTRRLLGKTPSTSEDVVALADAKFNPDAAEPNGSSIAVLAEYGGKSALLTADAHAPLLVEAIDLLLRKRRQKKLRLDAFKVSHHASQNNLNVELMQRLDCRNYLISTNGAHFNHPDREAIARAIHYGGQQPRLWFNCRSKLNEVWAKAALQQKYGYEAVYPEAGAAGLVVRL